MESLSMEIMVQIGHWEGLLVELYGLEAIQFCRQIKKELAETL